MKIRTLAAVGAALVLAAGYASAEPLGTTFTYQGQLTVGGSPANGTFDFTFTLLNESPIPVAGPVTNAAVAVGNGLFTVTLDFGAVFDGNARSLEIGVRTNGSTGDFTPLSPRQPLTPTPYALYAPGAGTATTATTAASAATVTANGVNTASLQTNAVTTDKIADGTIAVADLSPAVLSNTFWRLSGNPGTTPGVQFVGTTDNRPLELKVNGLRALRLEPTASNDTVNVVGGSAKNFVTPGVIGATIGGGGSGSYWGGAWTNSVSADFGTVSGGMANSLQRGTDAAAIGGGEQNTIHSNAWSATIAGGYLNEIFDGSVSSTIGGGEYNAVLYDTWYATIAGGTNNTIEDLSDHATIGGGRDNYIETGADAATIGGGWGNTIRANALFAVIPGGLANAATDYAFAVGRRAKAIHSGAFVWGDSTDADVSSFGANTLAMRAAGGYRLYSSTDTSPPAPGVALAAGASAWSTISDRAAKKDVVAVDVAALLEKLVQVPVQQWRYQWEPASTTPHLGPTAQDFKAAFYPGRDDKSISTLEFDGVALAAIQGLNQKLEEQAAQLRAKDAELQALRQRLEALEQHLSK